MSQTHPKTTKNKIINNLIFNNYAKR